MTFVGQQLIVLKVCDPTGLCAKDQVWFKVEARNICNDGLDNDNDGYVDWEDPGCWATNGWSEYKMDSSDEDGLYVGGIAIYGNDQYKAVIGDPFWVRVELSNRAERTLESVRASIMIPELGLKLKSRAIDLSIGEEETLSIHGYIPDYAEPGEYYIQIQVSDGDILRTKWRFIDLVDR
jgi:hypothetical protein